MTREEFVDGYMTRSELLPYTLDGDVVTFHIEDSHTLINHALECHCEEDECEGWAMVPEESQNWHKWQNRLTAMTYQDAMAADLTIGRAKMAQRMK